MLTFKRKKRRILFMNDKLKDNLQTQPQRFIAQKCPVCNSFGTVTHNRITCHGCNGRGYIIIDTLTGFPVEEERKLEKDES